MGRDPKKKNLSQPQRRGMGGIPIPDHLLQRVYGAKQATQMVDDHPVYRIIEDVCVNLGLETPLKRFIFGFTMTETFVFMTKPAWAFTENGTMRTWDLRGVANDSTMVAWWVPGLLVGAAFSIFV